MGDYAGAYRAKVIAFTEDGLITVQIPQLFGENPVKVIDLISEVGRPLPGTMGWVIFASGEPEWPVWIGAGLY